MTIGQTRPPIQHDSPFAHSGSNIGIIIGRIMNRKYRVLLLLLGGLWLAPAADAQKLTGELILTQGVVKIRRRGRERFYNIPMQRVRLFEKDVVQTGAETRATLNLRLKKAEVVQLYAGSYIRLEAVRGDRTTIVLASGKALFTVSRPPPFHTGFEVKTRNVVISARGTRFIVGSENSAVYVLALEGKVAVARAYRAGSNLRKRKHQQPGGKEATIAANQAIIAGLDAELSDVVEVSEDEREAIIASDSLAPFRELEVPIRQEQEPEEEGN